MECDLGNITIHYEAHGEGIPIIFLHGWSEYASHLGWLNVMEPFFQDKDGWQRIYVDLPGMGKTPGADWITGSEDVVNILLKFIDQLFPNQKIILAGNSWGGYLAQGIVFKKPEIVNGLCLLAPVTRALSKRTLPDHVVLVENKDVLKEFTDEDAEIFKNFIVVQNKTAAAKMKSFIQQKVLGDVKFMDRFYENYINLPDVEKLPKPFEKPSLIITGRQDSIVGFENQWGILKNYPRATYSVLDNTGHLLFWEQEQLTLNLFGEWLDRVEENIKLNS